MRYFRITRPRYTREIIELLREEGFEPEESFWPFIFKVKEEHMLLGSSLANCFGLIYIQDKSSFLPPLFLNPSKGSVVLDMCASPGSKTGLLATLVGQSGLVIANEPNSKRAQTLSHNLARCNHFNVITTQYRGELFPDFKFPYILLDVPCSGWGTGESRSKVFCSKNSLKRLINIQQKLLSRAKHLLKPGGYIVYSTCTTNVQENEEQIEWAIDNLDLKPVPFGGHIKEVFWETGLRPNTYRVPFVKGESQGFFITILKPEIKESFLSSELSTGLKKQKKRHLQPYPTSINFCCPGSTFLFGQKIFFVPKRALSYWPDLNFRGTEIGVKTGKTIKFKSYLKEPELQGKQKICLTDLNQLKKMIQGEIVAVANGQTHQTSLLYYKNLPLGWVKIKQNRLLWK
ncbi:MAG: RsmB/NOP family class I SAM-dependent RNA methyltransferase [Desulfonauticus sp.]|nr:RsmB/NOP family class I SAM-dependent RNA methyltransferase [Desulfonauticus sp.]